MKKYFPIAIGVVVIGLALFFLRQYSIKQTVLPAVSEQVAPTITQDQSEVRGVTPTVTPGEATRVSGITLSLSAPSNNSTVSNASITVRGKTVAGAEIFVNDEETKADASGNFSLSIPLDEGENYLLVVANDAAGNYAEKELTVTYSP